MKERPILMSAPMVRAILEGRKTQTRRIVAGVHHHAVLRAYLSDTTRRLCEAVFSLGDDGEFRVRCPYGFVDRLWVRETWQPLWANPSIQPPTLDEPLGWKIGYPATDGVQEYHDPDDGLVSRCRPAIFMRRWMSRLVLEITDVRVERLHAITEDDVRAEGVDAAAVTALLGKNPPAGAGLLELWKLGWDAINGDRAPWSANPFVWRVEFRRLPPEEAHHAV